MTDHSIATQLGQRSNGQPPGNVTPLPQNPKALPPAPPPVPTPSRRGFGASLFSVFVLGILALVVIQIVKPFGFSPLAKLGAELGEFVEHFQKGAMERELCQAEQEEVARRLSQESAEFSKWQGYCQAGTYFGAVVDGVLGEAGIDSNLSQTGDEICSEAVRERFETTITQLRQRSAELKWCRP